MPRQAMNSEIFDQSPPHDLEAEKAVLGSILLKPDFLDDVFGVLEARHFYVDAHRRLYAHLVEMRCAGHVIDTLSVTDRLKQAGELEAVGGAAYLVEVLQSVAVPHHAVYYAELVAAKAKRRGLIQAASDMLVGAYDLTIETEELVATAETSLNRLAPREADGQILEADQAVAQALCHAEQLAEKGKAAGQATGLADYDRLIGGLFPGELVVLAARPRMGKTSLAIQITTFFALRKRKVLFASLEMAPVELTMRMLCAKAGVDSNRVRTGMLNENDLKTMSAAAEELHEATFAIDGRPGLTVANIRAEARRRHGKEPLSLIVVDYLQRLVPNDPRLKRHEQVGQMSGDLKRLALELQVPVLAVAALNRETESSSDRRPRLSHLRESGDIEFDADVVMLLHRPEVYRPADKDLCGKAELIVEKNRNGPTGVFDLLWDAELTTFRTPVSDWAQNTWATGTDLLFSPGREDF
ncbi:MAG TPA: replicative DNA helicase [Phycisphaerae bacterium]|nr:replicative DNA helicase [Phycisphaerae bacterium]